MARAHLAKNSRSHHRAGAVTVEFAMCASLFFLIVFAGLEFARFMFARHAVDQAAYEGARVGIVAGARPSDVTARVQQMLSMTGIRNATITVTPANFTDSTTSVTVQITCPISSNTWVPVKFFSGKTIQSRITLDHENKALLLPAVLTGDIGNNDNEPHDI